MNAELIAVGSELLQFGRHDTNGDWLAARLTDRGVGVVRRTIVGDEEEPIADAIVAALRRCQLVLITGGLGPTADDLTREGLARSLGRPLRVDPVVRADLEARLAARGYRALGAAEMQARVPEGCEILQNSVGSAPGIFYAGPPGWIVVLPGVPGEMRVMFERALERLGPALPPASPAKASLLVAGMAESDVDESLRGLIGVSPDARVTILASEGAVALHVLGTSADPLSASREVARIVEEIRRRLGDAVCGEGEATLASVVGERLVRAAATLAVAESCTGGLLGAAVTAVPGSSAWFVGGVVAYSNRLKQELLGVPASLLESEGAVSEPVARAMAEGARARTGASHALAITGIAGPEGAAGDKPVGLVYVALAAAETKVRRFLMSGDRHGVRTRSVNAALEMLRRELVERAL